MAVTILRALDDVAVLTDKRVCDGRDDAFSIFAGNQKDKFSPDCHRLLLKFQFFRRLALVSSNCQ
jgi:hypothetical protein